MWFPIPIPPFVKQILFKPFAHFLLCCFLKIDFWKFLKYLDVSSLFSHRMELVFSFWQWCLLKSRRCSFVGWSGHPLVVSEWHKDSSKHLNKKLLEAISQHLWRTYFVSGANNLLGTKNWCWELKAYYLPKTKNLLHIREWEPTVFQELRTYSGPRTKNLLCIGGWKPTVWLQREKGMRSSTWFQSPVEERVMATHGPWQHYQHCQRRARVMGFQGEVRKKLCG